MEFRGAAHKNNIFVDCPTELSRADDPTGIEAESKLLTQYGVPHLQKAGTVGDKHVRCA